MSLDGGRKVGIPGHAKAVKFIPVRPGIVCFDGTGLGKLGCFLWRFPIPRGRPERLFKG